MKRVFIILMAAAIVTAGVAVSRAQVPVPNANYCINPIYSNQSVKPNVMIVQDFSGSMQFPAYQACSTTAVDWYGYDGNRTSLCGVPAAGTSNYSPATDYWGYFDNAACYQYSSTNGRFETVTGCSCGTGSTRYGTSTCISGNVLNWFTTTRLDASRKALTGGRLYGTTTDTLLSEGTRTHNGSSTQEYNNTDSLMNCRFSISATSPSARTLRIRNRTSGVACSLGDSVINGANIRVKVDDTTTINGLVQDFYDQVDFEFMIYNTNTTSGVTNYGVMRAGKGTALSTLVSTMNSELAYNGTPTGEALRSARDFFRQTTQASGWPNNNSYISLGDGTKDPFYDYDTTTSTSSAVPCRKAYILLISDGFWNGTTSWKDPVTAAYQMRTTDLRTDLGDTQNVTTYAVFAFNTGDTEGEQAMKTTAIFGGFTDDYPSPGGNDLPYGFSSLPSSSLNVTYPLSVCNPSGTYNTECREWDTNGDGVPDNYFRANSGDELLENIRDALNAMIMQTSSGSGASVLGSFEGSGANLFQALYYPKRQFGDKQITWTGAFRNLWYYVDPYLETGKSGMREDTAHDLQLKLEDDRRVQFYYDNDQRKTRVRRLDNSGNILDVIEHEEVTPVWESGGILHAMSAADRNLFTYIKGAATPQTDFTTGNASLLMPFMQATDLTEAQKIISYIRGTDNTTDSYRDRTVTVGTETNVWKLGDIITSTARVAGNTALNTYHFLAPGGYGDLTYATFVNTTDYKNRGMVYVGANDGMLHAFELGKVTQTRNDDNKKAEITTLISQPGREQWAFIPQNVLPYLTYLKNQDYKHIFTTDGPIVLTDASINGAATGARALGSWETVLVSSMGIGGATRNKPSTGAACATGSLCVETPITDVGFSSYFALNVTNQMNPQVLWEFTHNALGFSTSGAAIVRVGDSTTNGSWFAVIASGPTGPIETESHQFMADSDQTLKLFVLDLQTGTLLTTIDTGISNAFGGLLTNATMDIDRWKSGGTGVYSDDVLYLGYSNRTAAGWKGGVLRLLTGGSANPATWSVSKVIEDIGPVTSGIGKLLDKKNGQLWLYFGTGRYYYKLNDGTIDSATDQQTLYGVDDTCYQDASGGFSASCGLGMLTASTTQVLPVSPASMATPVDSSGLYAERCITTPYIGFNGIVNFVTFAPSKNICTMGGEVYLWTFNHNDFTFPTGGMRGSLVLNLGGGNTSEATPTQVKTYLGQGIPASESPKGIMPQKPMKRILHIREK